MPARKRLFAIAAAVVIMAGAVLVARRVYRDLHDVRAGLSKSRIRLVEGRLANVDWSAGPLYDFDLSRVAADPKLLASVRHAVKRFGAWNMPPSIEFLRSVKSDSTELGNFALAKALEGNIDEAVTLFRIARMSSDASALRLRQFDESGNERLALDALVLADEAIAAGANLAEAHFNRALALEKLGLEEAAMESWRRSLAANTDRKWGAETNLRIRRLSRPSRAALWLQARPALEAASIGGDPCTVSRLVREFPMQARTSAEGEYLGAWAEAGHRGDAVGARHNLDVARAIGLALREFSGESLLIDAVRLIDLSTRRRDRRALDALVRGHLEYRRAMRLHDGSTSLMARMLEDSAGQFEAAGSPMAGMARCFAAKARFESGATDETLDELRQIEARADGSQIALRAHVQLQQGIVLSARGEVYDALEAYRHATLAFGRLHDEQSEAIARARSATMLHLIGDPAEAWRVRRTAFRVASRSGDPRVLELVLAEAAFNEHFERKYDSALALYDVASGSVPPADPSRRFQIVLWSLDLRFAKLHAAESALAAIREPAARADAENDLRFAQARAFLWASHPAQSNLLLSGCIDYALATRRSLMLPYIYLHRAAARARMRDDEGAIADFRESLRLLEYRRKSITNRGLSDVFVGVADDSFDELLDLYWRRGEHDEVFALGERRRGHIFLAAEGVESLSASEIAARLPAGLGVLVFTSCRTHTLATLIERGRHQLRWVPNRELLERKRRLRDAITHGRKKEALALAGALYSLLIGPNAATDRISRLVIVTDAPLKDVPFSFLRDGRTGKHLIEQLELVHAPSASMYVQKAPVASGQSLRTLVAVGNPAFDRDLFAGLSVLPAAARETRAIARFYPRAHTFLGHEATASQLTKNAASADVLNIATHAVQNAAQPTRAQLLFAPDGDEGVSDARRMASLPLKSGSTIVVAGCQTAINHLGYGDMNDFAGAFLAAGAGHVLATLWDIEDDAARSFSVRFHRALITRQPISAARDAQLAMLRSRDPALSDPGAWSGFQVYTVGQ